MALLKREAISAMTYPQWVIDTILPAEAVSMVYGPSGKGKSFWLLDMAACVATGRKWHGHAVQQGPVVYVAGEGKSGYKARLEAWEKQHNICAVDFCLEDEPVRLWRNQDSVNGFIDRVRGEAVKPVLVVFDTLGTCLGGANENDNGQMRELLDSAEDIRRALGNTAVLLVHHTGKAADSKSPRGAQALADGVAMHAFLSGDGKAYGVLECTKQKDGELFQPIRRTLHKVNLGKGATSLSFSDDFKSGPRMKQRRVSWDEVRAVLLREGTAMTPASVAAHLDWDRKAAQTMLIRAVQQGNAYQPEKGVYALEAGYVANVA